VHISSIYRLLERHGWRKLVPRPRHPKANPEAQAVFKKTVGAIVKTPRWSEPSGAPRSARRGPVCGGSASA
jgi:hypothetical protein